MTDHPTVDELIARSNRLGADPRNTNYAGGNTSAKGTATDPVTGAPVELVWVKGSGGDLGTLTPAGLAVLRLDRLRALVDVYPGVEREDEMVAAFDFCLHGKGGAAPSIDTAMHGLVDAAARRPPAPGLGDRAGHRGGRGEAHRGVLRRPGGVGAVAAPGLPAGPGHRRDGGGEPAGDRRGPRRPRHHRVGRDQRGVRRRTRWRSSRTAQAYLDEHGVAEPFGAGRAGQRAAAGGRAAGQGGRDLPDDPRAGLHRRPPRSATTPTATRCSSSSPARSSRRWPSWARPARTTSCAPRSSRWWSTCPATASRRGDRGPAAGAARRLPGRTTGPTTSGTPARTRPPMRGADPAIVLVPGVGHVLLRRGTSRPPGWRASSTSTRST